jgi:hypothetical protein
MELAGRLSNPGFLYRIATLLEENSSTGYVARKLSKADELLPLNSPWRLRRDIENNAVDIWDLAGYP